MLPLVQNLFVLLVLPNNGYLEVDSLFFCIIYFVD